MWEKLKNIWKSDNLMDEAWKQSFEMLEICNEMYLEAVHVLRETHENKVNEEIRQKDKIVNKYERSVRKNVITHLAVQSPADLAQGMVLVSIVIDIERLGDYTKNIVGLATMHPEILKGGKLEKDIKKIEEAIKDQYINKVSKGSFIAVLYLTIDNAPTIPSDKARFEEIVITMAVVIIVIPTKLIAKLLL